MTICVLSNLDQLTLKPVYNNNHKVNNMYFSR
jgi:hypothetical protein